MCSELGGYGKIDEFKMYFLEQVDERELNGLFDDLVRAGEATWWQKTQTREKWSAVLS